jgi:hypothetical protein
MGGLVLSSLEVYAPEFPPGGGKTWTGRPFWTRICAALVFGFFLAAASSVFFMLHICGGVSTGAGGRAGGTCLDHRGGWWRLRSEGWVGRESKAR